MKTILGLTLIVEPDRQRFARFAQEAAEALGGNSFAAVRALQQLLPRLRLDGASGPLDVLILLDEQRLCVGWGGRWEILTELDETPPGPKVEEIRTRLKEASETTDTELLMRRNQQIKQDLEAAKERAAREMAELAEALAKKKEELQYSIRLAETDSLTGLLNRGAHDTRLREGFLRCRRQNQALCLLLLDLDNFKEINDTYGHQYGDEYLKRMAEIMRSSVREHVDHVCRFGGDEFAIIMFATSAIAERVAKKLLMSMDSRVSIGIARLRSNDTIENMIKRADTALYEAKDRGRGRYVMDDNNPEKVEADAVKKLRQAGEQ